MDKLRRIFSKDPKWQPRNELQNSKRKKKTTDPDAWAISLPGYDPPTSADCDEPARHGRLLTALEYRKLETDDHAGKGLTRYKKNPSTSLQTTSTFWSKPATPPRKESAVLPAPSAPMDPTEQLVAGVATIGPRAGWKPTEEEVEKAAKQGMPPPPDPYDNPVMRRWKINFEVKLRIEMSTAEKVKFPKALTMALINWDYRGPPHMRDFWRLLVIVTTRRFDAGRKQGTQMKYQADLCQGGGLQIDAIRPLEVGHNRVWFDTFEGIVNGVLTRWTFNGTVSATRLNYLEQTVSPDTVVCLQELGVPVYVEDGKMVLVLRD
uniref:Matrix protein n=1 Tax=Tongliao Rhabd tick virus 1 TaxID=2972331 RepID=A0A9E7V2B5_9RHAB|nr:MAG: matrix protein [Tongliao Rhabd tick virus 1]